MDRAKANPVASVDKPPVLLSPEAAFIDGTAVSGSAGGIATDGSLVYSVARADVVPNGEATAATDAGPAVPANRVGRVAVLEHQTSQQTTYGFELEAVHMDEEGRYADLPKSRLLQINELYTFMTESGTEPTDNPDELARLYQEMLEAMVAEAESYGHFVGSLAVDGQTEPTQAQVNPSMYVEHVEQAMTARTGFSTAKIFRTGGAQGHTGLSNSEAGIKVAEAMQYLNPILMTPTLSGPLLAGGIASKLAHAELTPEQQRHMRQVGMRPDDFTLPYQSWRYPLRRLGSPSAGIWHEPAPDSMDGYLQRAHGQLAAGEINNVDRTNGWHTDRVRLVLNGSGANSIENCADDTALGRAETNVPLHLLRSAIITSLEQMAMRGADPRLAVAARLGTAHFTRQQRLDLAHRLSLREASRYGNDALVYGNTPGKWLPLLQGIAQEAPHTRITTKVWTRLRRMFATQAETTPEVRAWCIANGEEAPTPQAYFDLGLNNPAVYMQAQYGSLRKQGYEKEAAIRTVELAAGKALHRSVHRAEKAMQ